MSQNILLDNHCSGREGRRLPDLKDFAGSFFYAYQFEYPLSVLLAALSGKQDTTKLTGVVDQQMFAFAIIAIFSASRTTRDDA
jgi:hypothetical protein